MVQGGPGGRNLLILNIYGKVLIPICRPTIVTIIILKIIEC